MTGRAVLAVVVLFVAVQLILPAIMLFTPRPSPFGWQMYSAARSLPEVVAVDEDGSERRVDVLAHVAGPRAEIDYAGRFADQACRIVDAARIRITDAGGRVVEVDCR